MSPVCWFAPQMLAESRAGPGQGLEPGTPSGVSLTGGKEMSSPNPPINMHVWRELGRKWTCKIEIQAFLWGGSTVVPGNT